MADTIARPAVLSAARCRSPKCPRAGSATAAPASSIRRPTARSARSPRRHRPSRLADGGSCNQPAATACAGKSRSGRVRHCAAGVARRERSRDMTVSVNASWAQCCNHVRANARFPGTEPVDARYLRHTLEISHNLERGAANVNRLCGRRGYLFHNAGVTRIVRELSVLNLGRCHRSLGAGKEPI